VLNGDLDFNDTKGMICVPSSLEVIPDEVSDSFVDIKAIRDKVNIHRNMFKNWFLEIIWYVEQEIDRIRMNEYFKSLLKTKNMEELRQNLKKFKENAYAIKTEDENNKVEIEGDLLSPNDE
jgi:hypothetical protein